MEETPLDTLKKKIAFWKNFATRLKNREDVNPDCSDEKIEGLVKDCNKKEGEYARAVTALEAAGFK